jgi:hypothetical protein
MTAVSSLLHMPPQGRARQPHRTPVPWWSPGCGWPLQTGHRGDRALDVIRLPANAVVGAVLAVRGRAAKPDDDGMPVFPPLTTLADVRTAVSERLRVRP